MAKCLTFASKYGIIELKTSYQFLFYRFVNELSSSTRSFVHTEMYVDVVPEAVEKTKHHMIVSFFCVSAACYTIFFFFCNMTLFFLTSRNVS